MRRPWAPELAFSVVGACTLVLATVMWIWQRGRDTADEQRQDPQEGALCAQPPAAENSAVFADAESDSEASAGSPSCSQADSYKSADSTDAVEGVALSNEQQPTAPPGGQQQQQQQSTAVHDHHGPVLQQQGAEEPVLTLLDALGIDTAAPQPLAPAAAAGSAAVAAGAAPTAAQTSAPAAAATDLTPLPGATNQHPAAAVSGPSAEPAVQPLTLLHAAQLAAGGSGGVSPAQPVPPAAAGLATPPAADPASSQPLLSDWPSMMLPAVEASRDSVPGNSGHDGGQQQAPPGSSNNDSTSSAAATATAGDGYVGVGAGSSPPGAGPAEVTGEEGGDPTGPAGATSGVRSWGLLLDLPAVAPSPGPQPTSLTPAAAAVPGPPQLPDGSGISGSNSSTTPVGLPSPAVVVAEAAVPLPIPQQAVTPAAAAEASPSQQQQHPTPAAVSHSCSSGGGGGAQVGPPRLPPGWWGEPGGTWGSSTLAAASAASAAAGGGGAGPPVPTPSPGPSSGSGWQGGVSVRSSGSSSRLGPHGGRPTGWGPRAAGPATSHSSSGGGGGGGHQGWQQGGGAGEAAAAAAGGAAAPTCSSNGLPWLQLQVVGGPVAGTTLLHQGHQQLVLGRAPGCGLSLPDQEVSSCHATITWSSEGGAWLLVDSGSLNGTWVNGNPISRPGRQHSPPITLAPGDELRLGATSTIRVAGLGQAARTQPAAATTGAAAGAAACATVSSGEVAGHPSGQHTSSTSSSSSSSTVPAPPQQHQQQQPAAVPSTGSTPRVAPAGGGTTHPTTSSSSSSGSRGSPSRLQGGPPRAATWHGPPQRASTSSSSSSPAGGASSRGEDPVVPDSGPTNASTSGSWRPAGRAPPPRAAYSALLLDRAQLGGGGGSSSSGGGGGGPGGEGGEGAGCSPVGAPLMLQWPAGRVTAAIQRKVGADHRRQSTASQDVVAWQLPLGGHPQLALFALFDGHHGRSAAAQAAELLPGQLLAALGAAAPPPPAAAAVAGAVCGSNPVGTQPVSNSSSTTCTVPSTPNPTSSSSQQAGGPTPSSTQTSSGGSGGAAAPEQPGSSSSSSGVPPAGSSSSSALAGGGLLCGAVAGGWSAAAWEGAFMGVDGQLAGEDGCTATALLLEAEGGGEVALQCANVGDSAALLVELSSGSWQLLTADHRIASNPEEQARLAAKSGQQGLASRLYGLNIGRMLGDRFLKEQDVGFTALPAVSPLVRVGAGREVVVVVASDGLWDVVGAGRAAQLVGRAGGVPGAGADALMAAALAQRSKDDISILVVHIGAAGQETGTGGRQQQQQQQQQQEEAAASSSSSNK